MQDVYAILSGRVLDKRNFRKRVLSADLLTPTLEEQRGAHRPALLYEFTAKNNFDWIVSNNHTYYGIVLSIHKQERT